MSLIPDSFDKKFIMHKLGKLESIIYDCISSAQLLDLEKHKDLFTNDFAFYVFTKLVRKWKTSKFIPKLESEVKPFLKYIVDNWHTNAFLLSDDGYIFGINDDGKIFVIHNKPAKPVISRVYEMFGYDYDVVDFPRVVVKILNEKNPIEFRDNQIFVNLSLMKYFADHFNLRITGDLIVNCTVNHTIIEQFVTLFRTFVMQKIDDAFIKHDLIMYNGAISFSNSIFKNSRITQREVMLFIINTIKTELMNIGFKVIDIIHQNELVTQIVFSFAGIVWHLEINASKLSQTFVVNVFLKIHEYLSTFTRKEFIQKVLNLIFGDFKEQTITVHLGNHKIIIHGYYLPVIELGNEVISIDNFFTNEIIFEHPEHITVNAKFDDIVLVRFTTAEFGNRHRMLRNEYVAAKLKR